MWSADVLSLRSCLSCSLRSCKLWRHSFSAWLWWVRSSCALRSIFWCAARVVDTGSEMHSRVGRCCRHELHAEVRSLGSSRCPSWVLVSDMVRLVWLIFPSVSWSLFSKRFRMFWLSWTRCSTAFSVLASASSATLWQRNTSFALSSLSAFAASSASIAFWFRRTACCWRFTSFLPVSCWDLWCEGLIFADACNLVDVGSCLGDVRSTTA
mmetsp:Transcript_122339/g.346885  ORF Transcript_122339/g.346885 Transcript_122339/m.346885 type:complete len:210 (-) Transcript_122339:637-1266(-)